MQEDFGWKPVHGDVFRPPNCPMLLSVVVGSGSQLFCMTFITLGKSSFDFSSVRSRPAIGMSCDFPCHSCSIVFACLGFLSPSNRGALMTAVLVISFSPCLVILDFTLSLSPSSLSTDLVRVYWGCVGLHRSSHVQM